MKNPIAFNHGPIGQKLLDKISSNLSLKTLKIHNDSHKHAGHIAMIGKNVQETHFRLEIVSDAFQGLSKLQRHRIVYTILDEELKSGSIHALQLATYTQEEVVKKK